MARCLLGSPLIWPGLSCLLSRPARRAEPVFNMVAQTQSWSQGNNKLYLQLSAGLNHWDYGGTGSQIPINISVGGEGKKGKQTSKDKYRWASGRISLCNLNFITCKYGAEVGENEFLWMQTLTMEFFLGGGLFCHKYTISHPQRASALLSFAALGGPVAGNL